MRIQVLHNDGEILAIFAPEEGNDRKGGLFADTGQAVIEVDPPERDTFEDTAAWLTHLTQSYQVENGQLVRVSM